MKFDVIIGNPPYQEMTNTIGKKKNTVKTMPLYQEFIEKSLRITLKYCAMIVPARWYSSSIKTLEKLRDTLIPEGHLQYLVDYSNALECFENVRIAGGVCYFLYNKEYTGNTEVTNIYNGLSNKKYRDLNDYNIIVRDNVAIDIISKIKDKTNRYMIDYVERNVFGINNTNELDEEYEEEFKNYGGTSESYFNIEEYSNEITLKSTVGNSIVKYEDVRRNKQLINKYKLIIGKLLAGGGDHPVDKNGQMKIISGIYSLPKGTICTDSYILIGYSDSKKYIDNVEKYIKTKFVRFLIYSTLSGLNITDINFKFVPMLDFRTQWDDEQLNKEFELDQSEIDYINKLIKAIE